MANILGYIVLFSPILIGGILIICDRRKLRQNRRKITRLIREAMLEKAFG